MKIFGSDGFRCEFGKSFLTHESIISFAIALSEIYYLNKFDKPIIIARDTRESGRAIEQIMIGVLNFKGIDVNLVGVLPTPGLSKIIEIDQYDLGCMITASHNSNKDNGVKLFGTDGFKLDKKTENQIEKIMLKINNDNIKFEGKIGQKSIISNSFEKYINSLLHDFNISENTSKILIDCSNGVFSYSLEKSLNFLDNIDFISNQPNGSNINLECGSLEPDLLLQSVKQGNYDYGIAFDGDGDRAIFVSNDYGVIETEKIAYLFFKTFSDNLIKNNIVTTEISNLAFKKNIHSLGAKVKETFVGDRYVIESVNKNNSLFGFEPSGHFYFPKISRSMDGLATVLKFIELVNYCGKDFSKNLSDLNHYQRVTKNIDLSMNKKIDIVALKKDMKSFIDQKNEKLVIRKSMWDPVLRIYYDFIHKNNFDFIESRILHLVATKKT